MWLEAGLTVVAVNSLLSSLRETGLELNVEL
jgi:hypothetical protein